MCHDATDRAYSLDWWVLRVCERWQMRETEFYDETYERQVRLLAYETLRQQDNQTS